MSIKELINTIILSVFLATHSLPWRRVVQRTLIDYFVMWCGWVQGNSDGCFMQPLSRLFICVDLFAQMSHYSDQGSSVPVCNRCLMLPQLFSLFLWSANRIVLFVDFLYERPSHLIARNIVNIVSFTFMQDNVPNFCQGTSTCSTKERRKRTGCPC